MKKKILSFLLCIVTVLATFPTVAYADSDQAYCHLCGNWDEEGDICPDCGCHYDGCDGLDSNHCAFCGGCLLTDDSHICGSCCCCSECYEEQHCSVCGACFDGEDCYEVFGLLLCFDCTYDAGFICENCETPVSENCSDCGSDYIHCESCALICNGCGHCFLSKTDEFCEDCGMCIECAIANGYHCGHCLGCCDGDVVCEHCGMCEDCAVSVENHCPECGACYEGGAERCPDGGEHCAACCAEIGDGVCPECERCTDACGLEICPDCGKCTECCREAAEAQGCTCGDYCVYSPEWDEHFCAECNTCFDEIEQCSYCGLCEDCCLENSACSSGMCVENPDYSNHFCHSCNGCFCEADECEYCGLCVECCENESDCSLGMCVEDPAYGTHFCSVCHKCFHETDQCLECKNAGKYVCIECCSTASHTATVANEEQPYIIKQPKDTEGLASIEASEEYHYATFTTEIRNPSPATTYVWKERYYVANSGTWSAWSTIDASNVTVDANKKTSTLNYYCQPGACYDTYEVCCEITNAYGTVTTRSATLICDHQYENRYYYLNDQYHYIECTGCGEIISQREHEFGGWTVTQAATTTAAGSKKRTCSVCGWTQTAVIPKLHTHTYSATYTYDGSYHYHVCTSANCDSKTDVNKHSFAVLSSIPATENSTGSETRKCSICGYTTTVTIPKLAHTHDFMEDYTEAVSHWATDGDWASHAVEYDDVYHWKICLKNVAGHTCGYKYDVTEHNYAWYKDTALNKLKGVCSTCGHIMYKDIPSEAVGHLDEYHLVRVSGGNTDKLLAKVGETVTISSKPRKNQIFNQWKDNDGTSTDTLQLEYGFSELDLVSDVVEMEMIDADVYIRASYTTCHHEHGTHLAASNLEPTCLANGREADYICNDCGGIVTVGATIPATGHNYELVSGTYRAATCNATGYTGDYICTKCGASVSGERIPKLDHVYGAEHVIETATCTTRGYKGKVCELCGKVVKTETIPALGHTRVWKHNMVNHWQECSTCGETLTALGVHRDSNGDSRCDLCGYDVTIYTVTYTDGFDDTVLFADKIYHLNYGAAMPRFEGTPSRIKYQFDGWSLPIADTVTCDVTYVARWTPIYSVVYDDGVADEVIFETVATTVLAGTTTPAFGPNPIREGYIFKGWSPEVAATVNADTGYIAIWEKETDSPLPGGGTGGTTPPDGGSGGGTGGTTPPDGGSGGGTGGTTPPDGGSGGGTGGTTPPDDGSGGGAGGTTPDGGTSGSTDGNTISDGASDGTTTADAGNSSASDSAGSLPDTDNRDADASAGENAASADSGSQNTDNTGAANPDGQENAGADGSNNTGDDNNNSGNNSGAENTDSGNTTNTNTTKTNPWPWVGLGVLAAGVIVFAAILISTHNKKEK